MPGTMPPSTKQSTMRLPSVVFWYSVSSNMMAPEMYSPRPGVVHSSCRYACRFTSLFSSPIDANRLPHVALDSSIARIPRPGDAIVFCIPSPKNDHHHQNYDRPISPNNSGNEHPLPQHTTHTIGNHQTPKSNQPTPTPICQQKKLPPTAVLTSSSS